ncbi:hypothetical protein QSE00_23880 [Arenibacter sp. M-2]|uniref:DUF6249 domain-containing protein n=1 Tax=Arenibacter sp. M-2 TaxID=3053612 RepID=UPI0025706B2C|nr:DUF6249 domain-containing protein [Arenibacter sp. M-2]MDL5514871.1 hypothetical protein [Arenibacter sp. M-2]
MLYRIAPYIMITAIAWMFTMILIQLMKYRTRKRMIETNLDDENVVKAILETKGPKEREQNVLKWTLLGIFGGLGLIIQEFLPYKMDESILPYGVVIILLSIGLLIYYLLITYFLKNRDDGSKEH